MTTANNNTIKVTRDNCFDHFHFAMFEWGSDPICIEDEEQAIGMYDVIGGATSIREVTDPEELTDTLAKLDVTNVDVRKTYSFVNGSEGSFVFNEDVERLPEGTEIPQNWDVCGAGEWWLINSKTGLGTSYYNKNDYTLAEAIEAERNNG